jgi:hypothetical protein
MMPTKSVDGSNMSRPLSTCRPISVFIVWLLATLITVTALGVARPFAQTASGGSISGYVTDQQGGALRGATVVVTSANDAYVVITGDAGDYRIPNLYPASYAVAAELPGFVRMVRDAIVVREGLNLQVNFTLTVGLTSEIVRVSGQSSMLESKRATRAAHIAGDFRRALPLSGLRTWGDFLLLTPGVVTTQARLQTYFLHGTNQASGVFLVDGADASSVLQGSTLFSQFSQETFNDIQIKTAGVDAASPIGLGPVVNISTHSGTDRIRGAAGLAFQPTRWNDSNIRGGQNLTVETRQIDASLGGPIVRDRWWFFGSGRIARNHTGTPRSAQQVTTLRSIDPAFSPFDNVWRGVFGFGKVTGRIVSGHDVLLSATHDVLTLGGAQPNEAEPFRTTVVGGPGVFGRLVSVWNGSFMTRFSVGYNGKAQTTRNLQPDTTGVNIHQRVFESTGALQGTGAIAALNASPSPGNAYDLSMWTVAADASWYYRSPVGTHDLEAGIYLQPRRRNERVTRFNNNGFQLEEWVLRDPDNPSAGAIPFHRRIFDVAAITATSTDSRDHAVYAQDAWRVSPRLTITGGLRVDFVERIDRVFGVVMQRSTEVGPRVGATWLMSGDQANVLRGTWGRVHENLSQNELQAGTNTAGFTDLYDTGLDGTFSTVFVTPPRRASSTNVVVDLDRYGQPYMNEITFGYGRQLAGQTSIDVNVVRREYHRPTAVEINAIYDGDVFVGYRDERQNEMYRLTANTWNWPVVTAAQIAVAKRSGDVGLIAAYTREWNHLAGTWQPNDPASFIQRTAFHNTNGIGFVNGCTTGGLSCPDGDSLSAGLGGGTWRTHVANAAATWRGPWDLLFATSYNFQTGPWSGPILAMSSVDPRFGPPSVTLSNGRVVRNPLATPVRFAYPTRAEGQYRLRAMHLWNTRVGRNVALGGRRLEVAVDVLNVGNGAADQAIQPGGNQQFSPFYGIGAVRQFPRSVQLSARLAF